jgi:putative DNA primase/helicase
MPDHRSCIEVAESPVDPLRRSHERSGEVFFNCFIHDDKRASLRINPKKDCWKCDPCGIGGNAWELMAARAGCDPRDKHSVLAWRDAHGFGHGNGNSNGKGRPSSKLKIVAVYDYHDHAGNVVHQTVRLEPKTFRQRRPDGNGGWIWSLEGIATLPYRLPELLASDPTAETFIVEGEKDVDAIRERGGIATCNPMGAGNWADSYSIYLTGRRCVVLPDNDEPGRRHAHRVASSLVKHEAASVKILTLPDLPQRGDVSDWFDSGKTFEQLRGFARVAPEFKPSPESDNPEGLQSWALVERMSDLKMTSIEWLWEARFALGKLSLIIGDPGLGKTTITAALISCVSRGERFPDGRIPKIGSIIWLSAEDNPEDTLLPMIARHGGDRSKIYVLRAIKHSNGSEEYFSLENNLPQLEEAIKRIGDVVMVVIDPIAAYLGSKDSYKDAEIRGLLGPLALLADRTHVAVLAIMHLTKNSQAQALYRAPGSIAFVAAARAVFAIGKDPDDENRRILAHVKNNLAAPPPSLAFEIVDGVVVWDTEPVNVTVDAMLSAPASAEERSERQDAAEFVQELLAGGSMASNDVMKAAKGNGFSDATIRRAKKKLNVDAVHVGKPGEKGRWYWQLPTVGSLPETVVVDERI